MKEYNFKDVSVSYGGVLIDGFADGDSVVIDYNREMSTEAVGADGEGAVSKLNDDSGTITLRLLQTSKSNDFLNGHALAKTNAPLFIRDNNGASLYVAENAWIKSRPSSVFGTEVSEREWILATTKLTGTIGGSDDV